MQSYGELVTLLSGLTVAGVTRKYTYTPRALATADLPASFVQLPAGRYTPMFTCKNLSVVRTLRYVIAVEASGQGTEPQNYDLTVDLLDALTTAIHAVTNAQWGGIMSYALEARGLPIGGSYYWSIIATVSVQG
jgi:hypothetical protein